MSAITIRIYKIDPESGEQRDYTPRHTTAGRPPNPLSRPRWPACRCPRCERA